MREKTLEELWREASRREGRLKACLTLYWKWVNKEIELIDPNPPRSFAEFLLRPDYSLWLWFSLAFITATVALVAVTEALPLLLPLRYLLGTVYVLFFPGFLLVERARHRHPRDSARLRLGPIFANVVMVDELNRSSPRTQSALLEAMQERQVTIEGNTYPLPRPFLVIATRIPVAGEGTYELPTGELDRFSYSALIPGFNPEVEREILERIDRIEELAVSARARETPPTSEGTA